MIKAIILDVDGVLTDGTVEWSSNGEESKRFSFADIMGITLARKAGITVALVSAEHSPLVDRFAMKAGITDVHKGCKDKAKAIRVFAALRSLDLSEICFMGDDVNDIEAMKIVGMAAAPENATSPVHCGLHGLYVTGHSGGNGAVRELVDRILAETL